MSKIANIQLSFSQLNVLILSVLVALHLTGCASPIVQTYVGSTKQPENSAIVLLSSDPPGALSVKEINGKTYTNHRASKDAINAEIHMLEGYHKLVLSFACKVDGTLYRPQSFKIENVFRANCVYQIRSWTIKPDSTYTWPIKSDTQFTFANRQAWVELVELGDPAFWGPVIASIEGSSDIWKKYSINSTASSTFEDGITRKNESLAHIRKGREMLCSFGTKATTNNSVFTVQPLSSESELLFEMQALIFEQPTYYQYREPYQYKPINIPKIHIPPVPKLPPTLPPTLLPTLPPTYNTR